MPVSITPGSGRSVAITNLGCKVNQAEVESVARRLRQRGVRVGPAGGPSGVPVDLHVVNTCTVTAEADAKSRAAVRRARRASPSGAVVVTGCSASVDAAAYAALDPGATVLGNAAKGQLTELMTTLLDLPPDDGKPLAAPLPTLAGPISLDRRRSPIDRTRAFIKVQDGCSFYCTYCLIPRARGPERSLAPDTVIDDVRRAVTAGHREVVLTGINIGTYDGGSSERGFRGSHRSAALTLAGLIRRILHETAVERLRISSIEPQHLDDDLLAAWADGAPRTMPHLHLPLQSGDDGILRRMGRRYDSAGYATIVERARAAIAGVAIHADVMAGFPTEDAAAHERSLAFLRDLAPAGLHVFRYSERPATAAVRMEGHVAAPERRRRAGDLLRLAAECRAAFGRSSIGEQRSVLFEERWADGQWVGRSEDYVEVAVTADGSADLANRIGQVVVTSLAPGTDGRVLGRLAAVA